MERFKICLAHSIQKLYNIREERLNGLNFMKFNKSFSLVMAGIALLLAGCGSEFSGNIYEAASVGEVSRTDMGTVISLRKVMLRPDGSVAGTALGAVGGGVLGSLFGGSHAKYATAAAGAVAGGVAGNAIATRTEEGIEYTVKLDNGSVITIAQGTAPTISVGQKVNIIHSNKGRSRIVPA